MIKESQTSLELWKDTIDSMDDLLLIISEKKELVLANKPARDFFSLDNAYPNKKCHEVFRDQANPCIECAMDSQSIHPEITSIKGKIFSVECRPVKTTHKNTALYVAKLKDITEQQDISESLIKNELKYRMLYEKAPLAYQSLDKNGYILDVNPTWLKIMGYTRNEVAGRWFGDFLLPEIATQFKKRFIVFKKEGSICDMRFTMKTKSGKPITVSYEGHAHYDKTGNFIQSYCVFKDITKQLNAEKTLLESEERFRSIFYNSPLGIAIVNTEGFLVLSNPAFQKMTGYSSEELMKKTFADLTYVDDLANNMKNHQNLLNKKIDVYTMDKRYVRKDGKIIWVSLTVSSLRTLPDEPSFTIKMVEDITNRKHTEKTLTEAKNKAIKADKLKSSFLANMSHEIRTPMNGIIGFSNLLSQPGITHENRIRFIRIIQKRGHDLLQIINDILDISKLESDQLKLNETTFSLTEFMDDIKLYYDQQLAGLEKTNLVFTLAVPDSGDKFEITGDNLRIKQVITNLIDNAIKFTEEGTIEFGYRIHQKKWLKFYVKDTGIGIPPHEQSYIFDRFRQADTKLKNNIGGNGLGLAICKGFIGLMGGKIWVDSTVGHGSTFQFIIPLKKAIQIKSGTKITDTKNSILLKGMKILLVEDDEVSALLLEEILLSKGANVMVAMDGYSAIRMFREEKDFDVVLLDIQLPDINGYKTANEIRAIDKKAIIIAQTAFAMDTDKKTCLEAGCNDYISKPIKETELLNKLIEHGLKT